MTLPFPHQEQIRLSEFSTFGIGGPARYFAHAKTCEQLQEMLAYAFHQSLKIFILGKGSNCLFADKGFEGLVILNRLDYLEQTDSLFRAGSGYSFARLGSQTARQGWSGLEFAAGIPATVGGAIYMNAGANGKETADTLVEVSYLTEKGERVRVRKEALQFSYRKSSFQQYGGAIVEGVFQLKPSAEAKQSQKALVDYRLKTQPYGEKSAGCAFRNPLPHFAGKLIEECGLKGMSVGGASISSLHGNFIVNAGGATAQNVLDLMEKIKEEIYCQKKIILEEEIRYIPYA